MNYTTQEAIIFSCNQSSSDSGTVVENLSFIASATTEYLPNALDIPLSEGSLHAAR